MSGGITSSPMPLISKAQIPITKITVPTLDNWRASGNAVIMYVCVWGGGCLFRNTYRWCILEAWGGGRNNLLHIVYKLVSSYMPVQ